jgi:hypothetical protein
MAYAPFVFCFSNMAQDVPYVLFCYNAVCYPFLLFQCFWSLKKQLICPVTCIQSAFTEIFQKGASKREDFALRPLSAILIQNKLAQRIKVVLANTAISMKPEQVRSFFEPLQ